MTVAVAVPARGGRTADAELAALARALGHPARVAIIRLLLGREACFSVRSSSTSHSRRQPSRST